MSDRVAMLREMVEGYRSAPRSCSHDGVDLAYDGDTVRGICPSCGLYMYWARPLFVTLAGCTPERAGVARVSSVWAEDPDAGADEFYACRVNTITGEVLGEDDPPGIRVWATDVAKEHLR